MSKRARAKVKADGHDGAVMTWRDGRVWTLRRGRAGQVRRTWGDGSASSLGGPLAVLEGSDSLAVMLRAAIKTDAGDAWTRSEMRDTDPE